MKKIDGGICAVENVRAAGACEDNYGVALIHYPQSSAAAVFTRNKVQAAPIIITRESVKNGKLSAIVANSGNANCFTGEKGIEDAKEMTHQVAQDLNILPEDVAVASTGIIGRQLPLPTISKLITDALRRLENSAAASKNAAEAIMTTDTYPKEFAVETTLSNGKTVRIGGICKGSGMIAPNMGTMLSFLTTDIEASPAEQPCRNLWKKHSTWWWWMEMKAPMTSWYSYPDLARETSMKNSRKHWTICAVNLPGCWPGMGKGQPSTWK